ncbi:LysR family transcriptional regulator [Gallaecimonas pentaromativorans]|uniref:LysR family transcriptional regulator n=1 Tax=Gallaecimonas pentaromativorans TaxID=584787 RepID=A0A3N1PS33_9GAMM|nr:LysR family transcriptional regulator [Gallaecimonas pentaromativorans]MED5526999.1 LysR family transcriptional regulator [Pseudomonadota bacterium]ROQ30848.1 LysR family transcriptional regulator [Gallaecimonas pentaromativorans]
MDILHNMRVFMQVAETGSYTAAASNLDSTTASVSRAVSNLEAHLQARLLHRSTRRLALTEVGQRYLLRCQQILPIIEEAEAEAADAHARPRGTLRLHSMTGVGQHYAIRAINQYRQQYEEVTFELTLANRIPDLLEEGFDMAIVLSTQLPNSSLISRVIGRTYSVLCASPDYLKARGEPRTPEDLKEHDCLRLLSPVLPMDNWEMEGPDGHITVELGHSPLQANVGDAVAEAAAGGLGIAALPLYSAVDMLRRGELVRVLPEYRLQDLNIHALYPSRQYLDAKVKTWVELLRQAIPEWIATDEQLVQELSLSRRV